MQGARPPGESRRALPSRCLTGRAPDTAEASAERWPDSRLAPGEVSGVCGTVRLNGTWDRTWQDHPLGLRREVDVVGASGGRRHFSARNVSRLRMPARAPSRRTVPRRGAILAVRAALASHSARSGHDRASQRNARACRRGSSPSAFAPSGSCLAEECQNVSRRAERALGPAIVPRRRNATAGPSWAAHSVEIAPDPQVRPPVRPGSGSCGTGARCRRRRRRRSRRAPRSPRPASWCRAAGRPGPAGCRG